MITTAVLTNQAGFPVFLALIKAIPWVLKCVLRSVVFSNRFPHTLHASAPSPSLPWGNAGDSGAEQPRAFLSSWFSSVAGGGHELGASWFSGSLTLCTMKRWRDKEWFEVKQTPHCRHCWVLPRASLRCRLMCSRNAAWSSLVKPQGAQRNPFSLSEVGAEGDRHFFTGLAPFTASSPCSDFTAALLLLRKPELPSCSEELSASSPPSMRKSWSPASWLCLSWICFSNIALLLKVFLKSVQYWQRKPRVTDLCLSLMCRLKLEGVEKELSHLLHGKCFDAFLVVLVIPSSPSELSTFTEGCRWEEAIGRVASCLILVWWLFKWSINEDLWENCLEHSGHLNTCTFWFAKCVSKWT